MNKVFRGFIFALFLLIIAAMVLFGAGFYLASHMAMPQVRGEVELVGLKRPVKVLRDEWGVPHLFAENEEDLFFAAGYVQAQDRLFQMDLLRRVVEGRLAEVLGDNPELIEADRFARTIGFWRNAREAVPHMSELSMRILSAYSNGINAFLEKQGENLPLEFRALGYKPDPWQAEDTMAIASYISWGLCMSWNMELLRFGLLKERGEDVMWHLIPRHQDTGPYIIPAEEFKPGRATREGLYHQASRTRSASFLPGHISSKGLSELLKIDARFRSLLTGSGHTVLASNSWVVNGTWTDNGHTIFCNDPHLELTLPSVWYEMHLCCPGYDVIGVVFPGTPMIILGHSRRIAWGATTTTADMEDIFIEKVNPENPDQYLYKGRWLDFQKVVERINVKRTRPGLPACEEFEVRISRHGPVISDVVPSALGKDAVLALKWTGEEVSDAVEAVISAGSAEAWDEFRRAIHRLQTPVQNWLYADVEGNIGYIAAGKFPVRTKGDGTAPVPGWTGEYEWEGFVPLDELPQVYNPESGYIVTANNKVLAPEAVPYVISYNYGPSYRAIRIVEKITEKNKGQITFEDMLALQYDHLSVQAQRLVPYLLAVAQKEAKTSREIELAIRHLTRWDFNMTTSSPAPSIFFETYRRAFEKTYQDEMSRELFEEFESSELVYNAFDNMWEHDDSGFFDDRGTPEKETRDQILVSALHEALASLREQFGPRMSTWTWGRLHTLSLNHPLGGEKPLRALADLFKINQGPFPAVGGWNTVNNGYYSYLHDVYEIKIGPSLRHAVEFSHMENSRMIITGGQSGQPFHPHYADQTELWLHGGYHPMWMKEAAVREHLEGELILNPVSLLASGS